jgi:hypothetical protein
MISLSHMASLRCGALRSRLVASAVAGIGLGLGLGSVAYATTVTIAVPNNNDLIEMKKLSPVFEKANPDIQLKWIVLEENVLRQRLTTDITTNGGQFDVSAIGTYEAPLWGKRGWLVPITGLPASYDLDDVLKSVRDGLSYNGTLYALPFNAESSMTFYRKDLFAAKGLTMPDHPTYSQISELADKLNDRANGVYGICLRGKAGWGENMAFVSTLVNTYGGRYFERDQFLRRPVEERWTAGSQFKWLQRKSVADDGRQVRDLGRRDIGRRDPLQQVRIVRRRQGGLRCGSNPGDAEGFALALVVVVRHSEVVEVARCGQAVHRMGDVEGIHHAGGQRHRLGIAAAGYASIHLRTS